MARRDVIVIGASAGGIEAISAVLRELPADFDAAVFVVLHIPASGGHALAQIFGRAGPLPVILAEDGMRIEAGRVYVAVADHHLVLVDRVVGVRRGPRENGHRPSVDALFRSAAHYYGPRVIGVVLSGTLDDGAAGALAIRRQGGLVVVQQPSDASYDGMPCSTLEVVGADHVAPAREIGPLLAELSRQEVPEHPSGIAEEYVREVLLHERDDAVLTDADPGVPSPWPCPDCDGVLRRIDDGEVLRFRCRVGHAWTAESLVAKQGEAIEQALWIALRSLEDRAALSRTLAERSEDSGRPISARRFRADERELESSIEALRSVLERHGSQPLEDTGG